MRSPCIWHHKEYSKELIIMAASPLAKSHVQLLSYGEICNRFGYVIILSSHVDSEPCGRIHRISAYSWLEFRVERTTATLVLTTQSMKERDTRCNSHTDCTKITRFNAANVDRFNKRQSLSTSSLLRYVNRKSRIPWIGGNDVTMPLYVEHVLSVISLGFAVTKQSEKDMPRTNQEWLWLYGVLKKNSYPKQHVISISCAVRSTSCPSRYSATW